MPYLQRYRRVTFPFSGFLIQDPLSTTTTKLSSKTVCQCQAEFYSMAVDQRLLFRTLCRTIRVYGVTPTCEMVIEELSRE